MTEDEVNKAVFTRIHLKGEPELYRLCVETCSGMDDRGWKIVGFRPPSAPNLPCLSVSFMRRQGEWARHMTVLFGREWLPCSGGMQHVAKITDLSLTKGTSLCALPIGGAYAVHVHQYDPCLTATVLNTLSDEEVIADYSAEARYKAAGEALHRSVEQVFRDMQD